MDVAQQHVTTDPQTKCHAHVQVSQPERPQGKGRAKGRAKGSRRSWLGAMPYCPTAGPESNGEAAFRGEALQSSADLMDLERGSRSRVKGSRAKGSRGKGSRSKGSRSKGSTLGRAVVVDGTSAAMLDTSSRRTPDGGKTGHRCSAAA